MVRRRRCATPADEVGSRHECNLNSEAFVPRSDSTAPAGLQRRPAVEPERRPRSLRALRLPAEARKRSRATVGALRSIPLCLGVSVAC